MRAARGVREPLFAAARNDIVPLAGRWAVREGVWISVTVIFWFGAFYSVFKVVQIDEAILRETSTGTKLCGGVGTMLVATFSSDLLRALVEKVERIVLGAGPLRMLGEELTFKERVLLAVAVIFGWGVIWGVYESCKMVTSISGETPSLTTTHMGVSGTLISGSICVAALGALAAAADHRERFRQRPYYGPWRVL